MKKDFIFGAATASYQVEGAAFEDGRGRSIWDEFCRQPGCVYMNHNGDRACNQYHLYQEDVKLMQELGLNSYRFSIAWPRIYPASMQERNPQGFGYYHKLIDALLEAGIEPAVTLYHWDLPIYLQGGWTNRETVFAFARYAETCFKELGGKVKMWMTLNEPWCSSYLGYLYGLHAPGHKDLQETFSAVHHLNLAHGLAVKAFREGGYAGQIGAVCNLCAARPATKRPDDILAADRARDSGSRVFLDPMFGRGYPQRYLESCKGQAMMPIVPGDLELIAQNMDFLGVNYYTEGAYKHDSQHPEGFQEAPQGYETSDMGWPIVPLGLYRLLKWVKENYGGIPLYITENGFAGQDSLSDEGRRCHDGARVRYMKSHFAACKRAMDEGVNLKGFYAWSLLDNFEWAYGYAKRFGLVYCDYQDMRRIPKDSYYYYREVIAGHEPFG